MREVPLIGVCIALSCALGLIVLWQAPMGGQVSLEPLPILVLALWRGPAAGMAAGALEGILHFRMEPFAATPLAILLDYPLAGAALGLAGVLPASLGADARAVVGTAIGMAGKFAAHVISGYLFFAQGRVGWPAWGYALAYNASYMAPSLVLHAALVPLLVRRLRVARGR